MYTTVAKTMIIPCCKMERCNAIHNIASAYIIHRILLSTVTKMTNHTQTIQSVDEVDLAAQSLRKMVQSSVISRGLIGLREYD